MEGFLMDDFFHLTALAVTVVSFLVISGKRVIELCSATYSDK